MFPNFKGFEFESSPNRTTRRCIFFRTATRPATFWTASRLLGDKNIRDQVDDPEGEPAAEEYQEAGEPAEHHGLGDGAREVEPEHRTSSPELYSSD